MYLCGEIIVTHGDSLIKHRFYKLKAWFGATEKETPGEAINAIGNGENLKRKKKRRS